VDGDGFKDLVVGNETVGSQVKVFRYLAGGLSTAAYRTIVAAMPVNYLGGVYVAVGDLDGDRHADIIVGSNNSSSTNVDSRVRVFSGLTNAMVRDFVPFVGYRLGVRVAVDDLDGDGKADILIAPVKASSTLGSNPRIVGVKGTNLFGKFQVTLDDLAFQGGVYVG
jgi:serralysin